MIRQLRTFVLGRDKACDVVLADETVSRKHAELTFLEDGQMFLTDRRSKFGTEIAGPARKKKVNQEFVTLAEVVRFGEMEVPVADLVESIRKRFPDLAVRPQPGAAAAAAAPDPDPPRPWVKGRRLVRCDCGAVKSRLEPCRECGR